MARNPNPQGKGGSPVLAALAEPRAHLADVPPKQVEQVTTELFTSMFVLESEFGFKPVPGKSYYLYRKPEKYWLSMIGPEGWSLEQSGVFIGRCELHNDMTWTLALAPEVADDPAFMDYLKARRDAFEQRMSEVDTLDDALPVHEGRLSFYRRASAFALAHSLGRSMSQSGIRGLSYDEAVGRLTHDRDAPATASDGGANAS